MSGLRVNAGIDVQHEAELEGRCQQAYSGHLTAPISA